MSVNRFCRRLAIVAVAIVFCGMLLHSQISSALVTRGDTLAYWGHPYAALSAYERALQFDRDNVVAADRYAFNAALSRDRALMAKAIMLTDGIVTRNGRVSELLLDRALCFQHLGNFGEASIEFAKAGRLARDPRALMFAALNQRLLRHTDQFRQLLKEAVAVDPAFTPARRDLAVAR